MIITPSYANKHLTSVSPVAGGQTTQRQFHYEVAGKPDLLTDITDERGVRYATWTYDVTIRAVPLPVNTLMALSMWA